MSLRKSVTVTLFEDEWEMLRLRGLSIEKSVTAYVVWLLLRDIANSEKGSLRIREPNP